MRSTGLAIIATLALSVAGCYSPSELIQKGPTYSAQTAKQPKA